MKSRMKSTDTPGPYVVLSFRNELSVPVISGACVAGSFFSRCAKNEKDNARRNPLGILSFPCRAAIGIGEVRRVIGVKLPLPRYASFVARFPHQVSESFFLWVENSEIGPVPVVVSPRHDLNSGRRTEGLRIGMGKKKPGRPVCLCGSFVG